jgi:hypothetical protein
MISAIHTPTDERVGEDEDFYRIPAGGRWMEMDWERVGEAFTEASARLRWDAEFELLAERQRVVVRFPKDRVELVGRTMIDFHRLISEELGMKQYMSIWIDFLSRG